MPQRLNFDFAAFYKALSATVAARDINWKAVSEQTGGLSVHAFKDVEGPAAGRRQPNGSVCVVGDQPRRFHDRSEKRS